MWKNKVKRRRWRRKYGRKNKMLYKFWIYETPPNSSSFRYAVISHSEHGFKNEVLFPADSEWPTFSNSTGNPTSWRALGTLNLWDVVYSSVNASWAVLYYPA